MARNGRCFVRRCSRAPNRRVGPTSRSGWATRPSRALTPTATARPSPAAASARPAWSQNRFEPGSIHGKCADSIRCATTLSRRSSSTHRARISAMRFGSTPIARWCCRARPVTARNPSADRPRIITASPISRWRAASPSTTSLHKLPGGPGWIGNGAASRSPRIKPVGTGFRCISTRAKNSCCFGCARPTATTTVPATGSCQPAKPNSSHPLISR